MKFEWDENKEKINIIKHKVSFTEATEVFYDYFAVIFDDTELSYNATGARYGYNGTHEQDLELNADGNYIDFVKFGYLLFLFYSLILITYFVSICDTKTIILFSYYEKNKYFE